MKYICPGCGVIELTVAQQIGGKIVFAAAAGALGRRTLKNPMLASLCAVLGFFVGHYIDQEVSKRCPRCGAALRAAGLLP